MTPTQHGTPSISSASSGRFSAYHHDSAFSTSASETEGGCRYDVEELFRKKRKNTKSTDAQSYVLVSLHIITFVFDIIVHMHVP